MTPLVLSFGALCPDNRRSMMAVKQRRIMTTGRYRDSKAAITGAASRWWGRRPILLGPVSVHGRVWFPDNRKRDVGNFAKGCLDALNGVVYVDDSQVHDVRWTRAGVDRVNPRMELTVVPLAEEQAA